jgi:hypothetical protein
MYLPLRGMLRVNAHWRTVCPSIVGTMDPPRGRLKCQNTKLYFQRVMYTRYHPTSPICTSTVYPNSLKSQPPLPLFWPQILVRPGPTSASRTQRSRRRRRHNTIRTRDRFRRRTRRTRGVLKIQGEVEVVVLDLVEWTNRKAAPGARRVVRGCRGGILCMGGRG